MLRENITGGNILIMKGKRVPERRHTRVAELNRIEMQSAKLVQHPLMSLRAKRENPGTCQVGIQISAHQEGYTMG